ncbi:MAG: hypothetical protein P8X42_17660, partial [Calditrichaceae bacterium]
MWFYESQKQSIYEDTQSYLKTVADFKLQQIEKWREECIKDASFVLDSHFFFKKTKEFILSGSAESRAAIQL